MEPISGNGKPPHRHAHLVVVNQLKRIFQMAGHGPHDDDVSSGNDDSHEPYESRVVGTHVGADAVRDGTKDGRRARFADLEEPTKHAEIHGVRTEGIEHAVHPRTNDVVKSHIRNERGRRLALVRLLLAVATARRTVLCGASGGGRHRRHEVEK